MKKIFKVSLFLLLFFVVGIGLIACSNSDDNKISNLQKDLEASNARISELETLINGYSQKVTTTEETIVSLQEAIGDYLEELDQYHNDLELAKEKIEAVEKAISEGDDVDISEINSELEAINEILDDLSFTTQDLQDDVTSQNKTINGLKSKVTEIEAQINDPSQSGDGYVQVNLADKYNLVVGDNFQLFYRSVIRAVDPYIYYIFVTGDKGHTFNRYYEWKPDTAGTYSLTITVKDNNGAILGTDTTSLVVRASTTNRAKKILCIGDSLTANGQWIARGAAKYMQAGGTIKTIGTVHKDHSSSTIGINKNITVNFEGRSGWQWSSYLTRYDANTLSPFYINNKLSFADYITTNNLEEFDEVYIFMTFNGFTSTSKYDFSSQFLKDAKTLVDKIHSDFPYAKITLMGLPLTSTYAGLGSYYSIGSGSNYSDNYGVHVRIHEYDNFLEEWSKMTEYKSFMRYIDIKGQFDSEFNMPYESKQVNNTNTSVTERVGNAMGMHPSSNGYNQIGDAFFRALMSEW